MQSSRFGFRSSWMSVVLMAALCGCGGRGDSAPPVRAEQDAPEAEAPARVVRFAPGTGSDSIPAELAAFCHQDPPTAPDPAVRLDTLSFARAPRALMRYDIESHLSLPLRCIVRTRRQWDLIRPLTAIRADRHFPMEPSVDFGKDMLVVAAQGYRPTFSYGIRFEGSWMRGDTLLVAVRGLEPSGGTGLDHGGAPTVVIKVPRARAVFFLERR
jgi:hypothetical protein